VTETSTFTITEVDFFFQILLPNTAGESRGELTFQKENFNPSEIFNIYSHLPN
jgi:hypothetical protein